MGYPQESIRPDNVIPSEGLRPKLRTQITVAATERFRDWGISEQQVIELGQLTDPFDYGQVIKRIDDISSRNIVLISRNNRQYVRILGFIDPQNWKTGACSELAFNWAAESERSGLMEGMREAVHELLPSASLDWVVCGGQSDKYFVHPSSTHVWVELRHSHGGSMERVAVDPAFRRIFVPEDSPYKLVHEIPNDGFRLIHELDMDIPLGVIETANPTTGTRITRWHICPCILGIEGSGEYVYGVSWVTQRERRPLKTYISKKPYEPEYLPTIVPVVVRINQQGENEFFLRDPYRPDTFLVMFIDSKGKERQSDSVLKDSVVDVSTFMDILDGINLQDATAEEADPPRKYTLYYVQDAKGHF